DLPGAVLKARHAEMAHQDILVEIDGVVEPELNAQDLLPGAHLGDHGVDGVTPVELPVRADPAELALRPDAESERMRGGVVFLAHVRVIDVPDQIVATERDEQPTVRERTATRQANPPPRSC